MKTLNKVMEMFWLALGVVILCISSYMLYISDFHDFYMYAIITALPFAMFFARRFMRKRMEKHEK